MTFTELFCRAGDPLLGAGECWSNKAGTLDHAKLPEPYTRDDPRGQWPSEFHLSYAALRLLRAYYAAEHPTYRGLEEHTLEEVVDKAGGDVELIDDFNKDRQIDIADLGRRILFQAVPWSPMHQTSGNDKVDYELWALNKALIGEQEFQRGTGYAGAVGVRFAEDAPPWKLVFETVDPGVIAFRWLVLGEVGETDEPDRNVYLADHWHAPGVIQYNWSKLSDDEVDEAEIAKGVQEGRFTWDDLTQADVDQYAEKCEQFAKMYVVGAERLHTIQLVTDFVVGIIGTATIVYLSPGLGLGKGRTEQPGTLPLPRPTVTTPSGQPVPVPRPSPGLRVPAGPPPPRPAAPPPPP